MTGNITLQFLLSAILAVLAVLLVNPFHFWMPSMLHMVILGSAIGVFGLLAVFVLAENQGDERDNEHRGFAGRVAFLAGGAILLIGIVLQTLAHALDPWLVVALLTMVAAKSVARWYSANHR